MPHDGWSPACCTPRVCGNATYRPLPPDADAQGRVHCTVAGTTSRYVCVVCCKAMVLTIHQVPAVHLAGLQLACDLSVCAISAVRVDRTCKAHLSQNQASRPAQMRRRSSVHVNSQDTHGKRCQRPKSQTIDRKQSHVGAAPQPAACARRGSTSSQPSACFSRQPSPRPQGHRAHTDKHRQNKQTPAMTTNPPAGEHMRCERHAPLRASRNNAKRHMRHGSCRRPTPTSTAASNVCVCRHRDVCSPAGLPCVAQ